MQVRPLGWEDSLEEGTATHSSILAWRIPWTEEPAGLWSMGSQSWTWFRDWLHHHQDCNPPGSSVLGIFQVRILEWVAISFFKGSSWPRHRTPISCFVGRFLIDSLGQALTNSRPWCYSVGIGLVVCLWIMFLSCSIRILQWDSHLNEWRGNQRGQLGTLGSLAQFFV